MLKKDAQLQSSNSSMGHPSVSIIIAHFGEIAKGEVIHPDLGCLRPMDRSTAILYNNANGWIAYANPPARAQTVKQRSSHIRDTNYLAPNLIDRDLLKCCTI